MTFPNEPRNMLYELQTYDPTGGTGTDWVNVTADAFSLRYPTRFTSGVPNEYGLSQPSTGGFQLKNTSGNYSIRNPNSPLYKKIGRNTPVRISMGESAFGMVTSGVADTAGRADTPDSAALSITGDMDFRVDLELLTSNTSGITNSWLSGNFDIASKFDGADPNRSWTLILIGGKLRFNWFSLGTVASAKFAESISLTGAAQGRRALRVVLDVNNGAAGNDVLFYTAPTMAGPWTQLGTTITQAGTTAVVDGTAPLRVGGTPWSTIYTYSEPASATYYAAELRNGIAGTVVASPNFATQPLDPTPFTASTFNDAQGNAWRFVGANDAARVWWGNVDVRMFGESSSFPSQWDSSENDKWVTIDAAGLLRRLGTGSDPAPSGLKDWVLSQPNQPTSYFPLGGGDGTTFSYNLGRVGKGSMKFYGVDAPAFSYGKDLGAPWLGTGMELTLSGNGRMQGDVAAGDPNCALDFVFQSPHLGRLEWWIYDYPGNAWKFQFNTDADDKVLKVDFFSQDGSVTSFTASGPIAEFSDTALHTGRIKIYTDVGNTQTFELYVDGTLRRTSTTVFGGNPFGPGPSGYQIIYGRTGLQAEVNLAHLTVWSFPSTATIPAVTDFDFAARGFAGETAVARMQRISTTGAIPFTYEGNASDSMVMGPLYSESKLTQMRDAEAADMGILGERRDALGLKYRTRVSLVDQTPALTLDYAAGHVVAPFAPIDDDAFTRNDMTVTRRDGDSYRAIVTTGRLSISDPPVGVGRYHDETTINVQTDGLLQGIAAWLVNIGTVDQPRYPTVSVDLGLLAAAGLDKAARSVEFGDLLVIKNLTRVGTYEDVRLLVLGTADETVSDGAYKHTITWNCAPYQGYEGFVWANAAAPAADDARWDSPGSKVFTTVNSTATALVVETPDSGTLWTTDPTAFPFDVTVEGERMTVTNITGTSSPQNFTVVRSVNGVVKAQTGSGGSPFFGADVRLADPSYWSL